MLRETTLLMKAKEKGLGHFKRWTPFHLQRQAEIMCCSL